MTTYSRRPLAASDDDEIAAVALITLPGTAVRDASYVVAKDGADHLAVHAYVTPGVPGYGVRVVAQTNDTADDDRVGQWLAAYADSAGAVATLDEWLNSVVTRVTGDHGE